MDDRTRVFVYGTLKPGGKYHQTYCGEFHFDARHARIKGLLFNFPQLGYPGAIENSSGWIHGVILTFQHPEDEVLPRLDELEGYNPQRPPDQNEYYRKIVPAFSLNNGDTVASAWSYFMEPNTVKNLGGFLLNNGIWDD